MCVESLGGAEIDLVDVADGDGGEGDAPDGVVGVLDGRDGRRGAVLRPHVPDQDRGRRQAERRRPQPEQPATPEHTPSYNSNVSLFQLLRLLLSKI